MRKILAALTVSIMASSSVYAQFGGFGGFGDLGKLGGSGGATAGASLENQVSEFMQKSSKIRELALKSLAAINAAYSTDEKANEKIAQVKSIMSITDPAERDAKMNEVIKTESAGLKQKMAEEGLQAETKQLTEAKKKQIVDAVSNFGISGIRATELVKNGQGILAGAASNPLNVSKIFPVKDALPILVDAGKISTDVIPGFIKVMRGADLKVPEITASSTPVDADGLFK